MITRKLLTVIILPVVLMVGLALVIMFNYLYPEFQTIENQQAIKNANRVKDMLYRELEHIALFNKDWAEWDDAYDFMKDKNPDFIESNLINETYFSNKINLIAYVSPHSKILYFHFLDLLNSELYYSDKSDDWLLENILVIEPDSKERISGFNYTEYGILMLSACPVNTSTVDAEPRGMMYVGTLLSNEFHKSMMKTANTSFNITWDNKYFEESKLASEKTYIILNDSEHLSTFTYIPCLKTQNVIQIKALHSRNITLKGRKTILVSWIEILIIVILLLLIMIISLNQIVLKPINQLKIYTLKHSEDKTTVEPIFSDRKDEFGFLAQEIHRITTALKKTQSSLSTMSYKAGLSDMSGTFIHNIRNSMTPIVNLVEKLQRQIKSMHLDRFEKVLIELKKKQLHETDADLIEYYKLSIQSLYKSQEQSRMSIIFLNEKLRAIEKLMQYHEKWTNEKSVEESIKISDLFNEINFIIHETDIISQSDVNLDSRNTTDMVTLRKIPFILSISRVFEFIVYSFKEHSKIKVLLTLDNDNNSLVLQIKIFNAGQEFINIKETFDREFLVDNDYPNLHWCANTINKLNGALSLDVSKEDNLAELNIRIPVIIS